MKLLIVTQAIDSNDPVLGFFTRWVEEFSKHVDSIHVICLKEGKHVLPQNVYVHSLGKEKYAADGTTIYGSAIRRARYAFRFLSLVWRLRNDYDVVFVHMNPEYLVLAGGLWRLLSKRAVLWYTHKNVDLKLRIAVFFSEIIFTASKESFRLRSRKLKVMGHGIDVDFFSPDVHIARTSAVLSAGRLSPTKRNDLIIRAAEHFPNEVRIAGDGPEKSRLIDLAKERALSGRVHFFGARTQEQLRVEYRTAGVFVHTSETGSLDKVVLEALACGLPVVTTATTLKELPVTTVSATPNAIAQEVRTAHSAGSSQSLAAYVREHHSLQQLIPAILGNIKVS